MMTTTQQPSTKEDILQYLLKQGLATAQELAEALDISPQAIRRHLKDLEAEELIRHKAVQAGMGRPQHQYELTHKGKNFFPNQYDDFALSLLGTLAETMGEDQMTSILRKQWERKAIHYHDRLGNQPLSERVAGLVKLRQAEGYMAEVHRVEQEGSNCGDRFLLTEHNCAISTVAESFPSVCGYELEMFEAILPDCTVERTYWMIDGEHRCGYLITLQPERVRSAL
ncbi:iron-sulfur cluster biosynthesis transcriptional regulator SufR [Phormidium pseudopriestleyi FRX01]|uniref:Iron-sulfur cluster biosynthesis transcriptional regulator SufR n=1 Tax=Phormidium pseudopriestleyi FRX01 TaxID=1759528 RepID=A0ABS3FR72_9CYAN|nr:iron-sulfur cluster biosynthesis transcriptional regulator SufR [Phormidium pseudopriestleyi]MBO0349106.1 iron-sulfur cluster biosynthesis transcriptional regulator SufR [Phormidium pseudopriestleyi FRX01]